MSPGRSLGDRSRRGLYRALLWGAVVADGVLLWLFALTVLAKSEAATSPFARIALGVAVAVVVVLAGVRLSRLQERNRTLGDGPGKLGEPHFVHADFDGSGFRVESRLTIGEDALRFEPIGRGPSLTVPAADVRTIHVRHTCIEVEAVRDRVRVVPPSFAERQRLLFELAVRCNAAMEHGIEADRVTPAAAGPASPAGFGAAIAADQPVRGSLVPGLGSALAGPMDPGNRPPPRKSGLGVGLFPGAGADE